MVWFNIDRDCGSLEDYLGATIVEEISGYHIEEMVRVLDMTAETECNWKILTDNFNEGLPSAGGAPATGSFYREPGRL